MKFSRKQTIGENLLYLMVWAAIFLVPVLNSQMMSELHINLENVLIAWRQIAPYFVIFLIHNVVLAPRYMLRRKYWKYLLSDLALIIGVFWLVQIYEEHLANNLIAQANTNVSEAYRQASFSNLEVYWNIVLGFFMTGANTGIKLIYQSMRDEQKMEALKRQNLQAEMDYLKYQINPHFFMNTLNNIHALIDIDAESAKNAVIELSKMMRYVLYDSGHELISLNRDIQFLENYIELMRIRYTDDVDIRLEYPHNLPEQVSIPPLLLIVFVENAFKHGISYNHPRSSASASDTPTKRSSLPSKTAAIPHPKNTTKPESDSKTSANGSRSSTAKRAIPWRSSKPKQPIPSTSKSRLSMLKCIAIDDEPLALRQIAAYIAKIPYLELVARFNNAIEAQQRLAAEKVDLIFVDINMPDLNGVEFVRGLLDRPMVVFTTAYSEYAVEGFKLDAVDYLLKPFSFADFSRAAAKANSLYELRHNQRPPQESESEALPKDQEYISVKADYKVSLVKIADIVYIESEGEYVRMHLADGTAITTLFRLKNMETALPADSFMRVHRSYIVNLKAIRSYIKGRIYLSDTEYIPIGEIYKEAFQEYIRKNFRNL